MHRVVIAAALWLLSAGLALAAPAGTVVGVSGACVVESGGARQALALGQPVAVGDTVEVPADGKLKLRMADGSVLSIAAGSRLTVAAYGVDGAGQRQDARLSLGEGLLRAVVAPAAGPANFEVDTAVGAAAVRSTDWFVEVSGAEMRVGVLSGQVAVTSAATHRSELVGAHFGTRLAAGRDPAPPRAFNRAEFAALIARTRVARRDDRTRAPPRAHRPVAGGHQGGQHRRHAEPPPSTHKPRQDRPGPALLREHPAARERDRALRGPK